jgi:acyl carrier protein
MGLDSMEILMKIENTFSIRIPDREAEQIITVGDFHEAVWHQLAGRYSNKCKSQGIFYKLRQASIETFSFPGNQFKLETCPEDVVPRNSRRREYSGFGRVTGLELPALRLTKGWNLVIMAFAIAAIPITLVLSVILIIFFDLSNWLLLLPVAGMILTALLSYILEPKRTVIGASSMRVFIQEILTLNYAKLAGDTGTNRQEMEMVMNQIIADMAGLDLEAVTPPKKIGDDLGID